MALFVIAVGLLSFFLVLPLRRAFEANVFLNGLIVGVLVLGVFYNFRQVFVLFPEVAWIERFRKNSPNPSHSKPPKLLSPMATMLGERQDAVSLSTLSMRSLLDGIASRLDEARDLSRYTIGLSVFWVCLEHFGAPETVGSIRQVIESQCRRGISPWSSVIESWLGGNAGQHGHGVLLLVIRPRWFPDPRVPGFTIGPGTKPVL